MKNVLLSTAISATLLSGTAHATITVNADGTPTAATLAATTRVYLSGSSAYQKLIESALLDDSQNGICKTGTVHKYQDALIAGSSNQVAYLCELNVDSTTPNPVLTKLKTKPATWKDNLLLYKRNNGESLKGTFPVANNQAIEFLNVEANAGTCTLAGVFGVNSSVTCDYNELSNSQIAIPDFGVSDVEPKIFTIASGNAPAGTANLATSYKISTGVATVYGVAVTTKLRNALQEAQFGKVDACIGAETEACMPSLSSRQIAEIFAAYPAPTAPVTNPVVGAGKIHNWHQLKVGTSDLFSNASVQPASSKVHICSRTSGSGVKAQFGIRFLNNVCNRSGSQVVSQADYVGSNETGSPQITEVSVRPIVHVMASSGGVNECMDELDLDANNISGSFNSSQYAGGRWAIGFSSLDINTDRSKSFRFIKVDGFAPTIQNVANGSYPDWVESTYIYRKGTVNPLIGDKLTLVNEMINSFGKPEVVGSFNTANATHSFGTSGFLSVPNAQHAANVDGSITLSGPVNPLSYAISATKPTDNCRVPLVYSTTNNNNQGLQLVP